MSMTADEILKHTRSIASVDVEEQKDYLAYHDDEDVANDARMFLMHYAYYMDFPDEVYEESYKFVKERNWAQFFYYVKELKYFVLQTGLIVSSLRELDILKETFPFMLAAYFERPKAIAAVVREHVLRKLLEVTAKAVKDDDKAWLDYGLQQYVDDLDSLYLTCFTGAELSKWAFRQNDYTTGGSKDYREGYHQVIACIKDDVLAKVGPADLDVDATDFKYLLYLAGQFAEDPMYKDKLDQCVEAIKNIMLSDDFEWNPSVLAQDVMTWQGIGEAVVNSKGQQKNFIDDYLEQHYVVYEGLGMATLEQRYELAKKEIFFFGCKLMMLLMDNRFASVQEKDDYWKDAIERLFKQIHVCDNDHLISMYYVIPIQLAEAIATQKYPQGKPLLRQKLIEEVMDIHTLLSAIWQMPYHPDNATETQLLARIDAEWPMKKLYMAQHHREKEAENMDKFVQELLGSV